MNNHSTMSKVPAATLGFWIIKIAATTLGETGGDTVTMTLNWGYLAGTALFLALLVALVVAQILAKRFNSFLYWATIVASTTFGTTMADFADRSLGIGYTGGSSLLFICLIGILGFWYWSEGTISVNTVTMPEGRGVLLGRDHLLADARHGVGRLDGRHRRTRLRGRRARFCGWARGRRRAVSPDQCSRVLLFWAAFILTRPLGATVGDLLDKPVNNGGLALSRPIASAVIAVFIVACIMLIPQRAGTHPGTPARA